MSTAASTSGPTWSRAGCARVGERELKAGPGEIIAKPRGVPHTFWNPGDEPSRILEIISPGGFERYFDEVAELLASGGPDPEAIGELAARYGLEMDVASVPGLCAEHGLVFGA